MDGNVSTSANEREGENAMTVALVPYTNGQSIDRAVAWADLSDDERRRRAMAAAQHHDAPALCDLTEDWLTMNGRKGATVSRLTRGRYRGCIAALVAAWAGENLLHPGRMAATRWLRQLEDRGCKPSTTRVYLSAARALYAALRLTGATTADPFKDVHPAPDPVARWEKRMPYTDTEVARLLVTAEGDEKLIVLLGAHAGLRVAEMLALQWRDINLGRGTLTIQSGKGGKRRTVPLSGSLRTALTAGAESGKCGPVLPWRYRVAVWRELHALCLAAGVDSRGIHALRHTFGTRAYRETDLQTTQRLLGHSSIEVTTVYAKHNEEGGRAALASW